MKVRTQNIICIFHCINHNDQIKELNPKQMLTSGRPICKICYNTMKLEEECLVTN